jgi:glycosyltransferase involved in cell wall biosynthesis
MNVGPGEVVKLCEQMNLQTDAIVINQSDRLDVEEVTWKEHKVVMYSFPDRGVGRSRNEAILRATGDICLFSDQDIVYEDGYEASILEAFRECPKGDFIVFEVEVSEERRTYHNTGCKRLFWYNSGRYPTYSFAIKRDKLLASGLFFSLLFGGGAAYSNGEDSLFIRNFIQKGYLVYTSTVRIGREESGGVSTWFHGYNQKFFYDRGVLYHFLYGRLAGALALRFLLAHRKVMCRETGIWKAYGWMRHGIREAGK